ncbi:hypothetical protein D3C81_562510 [compost metagenome]
MFAQELLEFRNGDGAGVEHAGGERAVHVSLFEHVGEMLRCTRAAGGDQRNRAQRPGLSQLGDVVALADAVAVHAVQHDFARATLLHFTHPVQGEARFGAGFARVAGVGAHPPLTVRLADGVDADHHALLAKGGGQFLDQRRPFQRRRVDRDLVGAGIEHRTGGFDVTDATSHAEWNVDQPGDPFNPLPVHRAALGAGRDVVEHQFIGTFVAIAQRQFGDVTHVDVIAELDALDHATFAYVQTRNDATTQHANASSSFR